MVAPNAEPRRALFPLGRIVATPGALNVLRRSHGSAASLLLRHVSGDWGSLCAEDRRLNDRAVVEGTRILSTYTTATGDTLWVITEADRSATTLLLPSEY